MNSSKSGSIDAAPVMPPKRSVKFWIGVVLLAINVPFGYGGGAIAAAIGAKSGHTALGVGIGIGLYILSWGMLGLGILFAGPEGMKLVKGLWAKWFHRHTSEAPPHH